MSTIEYIQVTVTPHDIFEGAKYLRIDVRTNRGSYHSVVSWPNDDFVSHLDMLLNVAKQEIIAVAAAERKGRDGHVSVEDA